MILMWIQTSVSLSPLSTCFFFCFFFSCSRFTELHRLWSVFWTPLLRCLTLLFPNDGIFCLFPANFPYLHCSPSSSDECPRRSINASSLLWPIFLFLLGDSEAVVQAVTKVMYLTLEWRQLFFYFTCGVMAVERVILSAHRWVPF